MTFEQFDKFQERLLAEVVKMRDTKGKEYANSADRFGNFRRLSESVGLADYQVAYVYMSKHLDSIASYMKNHKTFSAESIRGRFIDTLTYLTLIAGMVEEAEISRDQGNAGTLQPLEYDPSSANR
jgi:hypothetical protein